ncbi:MAG: hypothetical protein JSS81_25005 [Acidobacteria bacterium]|nr:hypothetical protein [Acidobacteriota bacterium]
MFLLFDFIGRISILGFVPESLGVLIFGVGLVVLTVVLRRFMQRGAKRLEREMQHITKPH